MNIRIIYDRFRREKVMYSLFLLSVIVLALFLVYPLLILFYKSLIDPNTRGFTIDNYLQFYLDKDIFHSFLTTVKYGFYTVILTTVIAVPMAFGVSRTNMLFGISSVCFLFSLSQAQASSGPLPG